MSESVSLLQFVLVALKVLSALMALLLFFAAAGWLWGADNIAFPGLGLIVATPLLLILLTIVLIVILIAAMVVSALMN